ncbi:MAG: helix-turn-helix domain-containing protein [Kordiimonas sp.]
MNNEQTTVAELLKSARVERGLSIKYIASDICVRSSYLEAIEAADYEALPGKTFAIGFVKSYAGALGLDVAEIVEIFKSEYSSEVAVAAVPSIETNQPTRKTPGWLAPIVGLAGVSACWMMFGGMTSSFMTSTVADNAVEVEEARLAAVQANIAEPTVESPIDAQVEHGDVALSNAQAVSFVSEPVESIDEVLAETVQSRSFFTPAAYAGDVESRAVAGNYTLHAVEDSWVRIASSDGTEVWSGILREGQTYRPEADGVILLSTSNAGGVLLQVNGGEAESLGDRGAMVSGLKLEDMTLLTEQEAGELSEFGSE